MWSVKLLHTQHCTSLGLQQYTRQDQIWSGEWLLRNLNWIEVNNYILCQKKYNACRRFCRLAQGWWLSHSDNWSAVHWEHFAILTRCGEPNFCHHASCCVPCTALKQELLERGVISQRPIGMAGVLICCWQESRGHMLWVLVHPLLLSQAENGALTSWSELNVVSTLNFYCTRP